MDYCERTQWLLCRKTEDKKDAGHIKSPIYKLASIGIDMEIQLLALKKIELNKYLNEKMDLPLGT